MSIYHDTNKLDISCMAWKHSLMQRPPLSVGAVGSESWQQNPETVTTQLLRFAGSHRVLEHVWARSRGMVCNDMILGAPHADHVTSDPNTPRNLPPPPLSPRTLTRKLHPACTPC